MRFGKSSDMKKIVVSILSFGRPALVANVLKQIGIERGRIKAAVGFDVNVIIGLNDPRSSGTVRFWRQARKPRWLTIVHHDQNFGFGGGHNHAFQLMPSDIFVTLNDDIEFKKNGWLGDLICPILKGDASLVGASESPCRLKRDLDGTWRQPDDDRPPDYVEASIMAVNSHDARALGLFAEDLRFAYYEDSDLSLRFRQAGRQICVVSVPHKHKRGISAQRLPSELLDRVRRCNQARMSNRWEKSFQKGRFTNKVGVVLDSIGWGDVIASLPAILQLTMDHPTAQIDVYVSNSMHRFFKHPRIRLRTFGGGANIRSEEYDRIWRLGSTPYQTPDHLGFTIAASLGVSFSTSLGMTHLHSFLKSSPEQRSVAPTAIVHAECGRRDFEGRQPAQRAFIPTVDLLSARGYKTILIGIDRHDADGSALAKRCSNDLRGKTSLWDLAILMSKARLCVCTDSGPLHLAQLLHIPTFAVFGCTLPTSKITWWDNSASFQSCGLSCLGCYHLLRSAPPANMCLRRDVACMNQWSGEDLAKSVAGFLDGTFTGIPLALQSETNIRFQLMEQSIRASRTPEKQEFFEQPPVNGRERIVIFGAGEAGRRAMKRLPSDLDVVAFCDNDPAKWNTLVDKLPVVSPSALEHLQISKIVIASQYHSQISRQLLKSGFSPERIRVVRSDVLRPLS